MKKIIYIAGDGRSGSTLLDSILSNIENSISVGECHRFWIRFYEGESLCSCGEEMIHCRLWSKVDEQLKQNFTDYDPIEFKKRVKEIQLFKNFSEIPNIVTSAKWSSFCQQVKAFYTIIAAQSNKEIIVDSSKSVAWGYFLYHLSFVDIYFIHLERELPSVANSWKKEMQLPEYTNKEVFMPTKSTALSTKLWLKIKVMAKKLKLTPHYLFVSYEKLCEHPEAQLQQIKLFLDEEFQTDALQMLPTHAIGGNPMRAKGSANIEIKAQKNRYNNLSKIEYFGLKAINNLAKSLI